MKEQREKNQILVLLGMSVVIFAISLWAFVQGIQAQNPEGVVQEKLSADKAGGAQGDTASGKIDTDALVKEVLEGVKFDTELERVKDDVTKNMITAASEDTEIELYMGEGTWADELLIVTVTDEKQLSSEIEAVRGHLLNMQQSFQDYLPKEAKKIDDAIILQAGKYIVACVSPQKNEAKKIIEDHLQ